VDGNGGKFFDVQIDDLDNSGSLELLVTNHQGKSDNIKGSLFFYTLQGSNIRNATWLRNTIYDNFPVIHSGLNQVNFLQYIILIPDVLSILHRCHFSYYFLLNMR
jgi:hypothetical protein